MRPGLTGVLATVLAAAAAGPAVAGPDFVTADRSNPLAASDAVDQLVASELEHEAIELSWSRNRSAYHETRGITPVAAVGPAPRLDAAGRHGG
ncbi:MAG TPA: hypothetical protein VFT22_31990 [Kofleriaceae bacterium]|nr:hypothetical protein [Kofleriaceae bacterium]